MKLSSSFLAIALVLAFAESAQAKSAYKNYSGTIKVTSETFNSGRCSDSDAHANLCPSGSNCYCETVDGSYSGTAGKGTATIVGTVDETDGSAPDAGGGAGCSPYYAVIRISASKDNEVFELSGGSCLQFDNSIINSGGCVLASSSMFPGGAVVLCSGLIGSNDASGKITLKGLGQ
ncbi:MAG TPA: hypothetical protein VEC38_08680 [Candidatus Binataceae bacterium]|nr:hypothetical protein [Candidatus Binataceae bacterium]